MAGKEEQGHCSCILLDQESPLQVHIWSGISDSNQNQCILRAMVKALAKTLLAMQVERAYKREQEKAAAKAEKDAAKAQRHR